MINTPLSVSQGLVAEPRRLRTFGLGALQRPDVAILTLLPLFAYLCLRPGQTIAADLYLPVQIIRVADDDGSREARLSPLEAFAWLEAANDVYGPQGIWFTFDPFTSFTTVRSTLINGMMGTGDPNWDAERRAANQAAAAFPGKLVIIARWGPAPAPDGGGFSWWDYDFAVLGGFYDMFHCSFQSASALAHEVGHHLGLPHTFGGLFDTEAAAAADFATRGNNPAVYDGDGFSDTPPHPSIRTQECPPHSSPFVLNGVPFALPFQNLMSYYFEAAELTPQQTARAKWMLNYYQNNGLHLPSNQGLRNPLEAEALTVIQVSNATYGVQNMPGFGRDGWSGNQQLFIGFSLGGSITTSFSVANAGSYSVRLYGTLAPDFGTLQCSIDGVPVGPSIDAYAPLVLPTGRILLGTNQLTAGPHTFSIQCVGKNSSSTAYYFGFDCLQLFDPAANAPPDVQRAPLSQTVDAGANALLSVMANGQPQLSYQWQKDGDDIPGATTATWEIKGAAPVDSGSYSVLVTNEFGSTNVGPALFLVNPARLMPLRVEGERTPVQQLQNILSYGPQQMSGFGSGWSGNAQLFLNYAPGGSLDLLLWVDREGWYALNLAATRAPDFGQFQCYLDGMLSGPPIDAYATRVVPTGPLPLGIFNLPPGLHRLGIQSTGKNTLSSNYRFGVDYTELTAFDPPVLQALISLGSPNLVVTWNTVPNQSYQLEFNNDLASADWHVVTNVMAAGLRLYFTNALSSWNGQGYYRVLTR